MKFSLTYTSQAWSRERESPEIELNTAQDILDLAKKEGHPVIISPPIQGEKLPEAEIYDDYRE